MAIPPQQTFRDLPVTPWSYWETVGAVRKALDELERGMFRRAAHLADAMGRDDRIAGVLATRLNGLLSQQAEICPAGGEEATAKAKALAEDVEAAWSRIAPEPELEELMRWGALLNLAPAELVWTTTSKRWLPKLKVWHPSEVYWRWDTRTYWINTESGPVELPEPGDEVEPKWLLYTPHGYERGWMRGAVRALALPWLVRSFATRDWAHYSEQHGQGIKVGDVPISAPKEDREKFVKSLANLGSAGTVEAPMLPDGTRFDVRFVEAKADTADGFERLLGHAETAIAIVLLGQNLTTEVQSGSHAAAKVHDAVREDFRQADARKMSGALCEQVLRPYALYNEGDPDLAPAPRWPTEPPEDLAAKSTALQALGAFMASANTVGAPVDYRELLTQHGVPLLDEDEEQEAKPPAPPTPGGVQEDEQQQLSARSRLPPGARRGQAYVDRLVDAAVSESAKALDVDLQELRDQVEQATSPADLRRRLVHAYADKSLAQLTMLVERAQVLAELAGRRSVLEDA